MLQKLNHFSTNPSHFRRKCVSRNSTDASHRQSLVLCFRTPHQPHPLKCQTQVVITCDQTCDHPSQRLNC